MNGNTSTLDAATRRRQNFFSGTKRADDLIDHERSEQHTASDDPASARAELHLRQAITSIAQSIGIVALPSGAVDAMVQRATPALRSMSRQQLMALSPSSGLLQALAATTFNPAMTPEAAQRLRLEQIKASYHGTGTTMTDAQILGLVQTPRLGGRGDVFSLNGGTGGTGSSGARYADMSASGVSFQMTPQMYYARTEAVRLGVPWVGNTPELLRLGTPAVKAIAATNLKETGYKALREGAHYQAQDVVTFAKHAKIRGFDAEQAAHATRDLVQAQPNAQQQGLSQVLITFDRAMVAAHERPNDPAAQAQLQAAGLEQKTKLQAIAAQSSEQEARVRLIEDAKKVPEPFRATTAANIAAAVKVDAVNTVQSAKLDTTIAVTDATVAQRAATKAQVDDAFAAGPDKPASAAVPAPTAGKPVVVAAAPVDKTPSAAPAAQPVAAKPPAPK